MCTRSCIAHNPNCPSEPFTAKLLLDPRNPSKREQPTSVSSIKLRNVHQCPLSGRFELRQPLNFEISEVQEALRSLSRRKALPKGEAQAVLWKECTQPIARIIQQDLAKYFQPGILALPSSWHRVHIVLLPKANKPPTSPGNLRPISMLRALAKLLARMTAQRIRPLLEAEMARRPQYAYLAGRSTYDAIDRVARHCSDTRRGVAAVRPGPFRSEAEARPQLRDSIQISLDLQKAFDVLPHHQLRAALTRIRVPPDLIELIMYLYFEILMVFHKDSYSEELRKNLGVRQGCGLAPLLWGAFTISVMDKLREHLSAEQLTLFADDHHIFWEIQCSSFITPAIK